MTCPKEGGTGQLGTEDTTTDKEEDTVTDELAVEPEEDSPSAEYMLTDRDPTNR